MATRKLSHASSSQIVSCLLGLSILYQIVHHFIIHRALVDSEDSASSCDAGPKVNSPHCIELHFFRTWKDAERHDFYDSEHNLLVDLSSTTISPVASMSSQGPDGSTASPILQRSTREQGDISAIGNASGQEVHHDDFAFEHLHLAESSYIRKATNVTNASSELSAHSETRSVNSSTFSLMHPGGENARSEFDNLYLEMEASLNRSHITPWEKSLQASQDELESLMKALPSTRIRQHEEWEKDFNKLYEETLASIRNRSSDVELDKYFDGIRRRVEERVLTMTPTGDAVGSAAGTNPPISPSRAILDAELTKHTAAFESNLSQMQTDHYSWILNFSNAVDNYTRNLCADPQRRNNKACAKLSSAREMEQINDSRVALRGARGRGSERMRWSAVVASSKFRTDETWIVGVTREDLRQAKWDGSAPKVACITAVPSGHGSRIRLPNFLQEFHKQTYDGEVQLVLVYSPTDIETAELVRANADGVHIKAVAAGHGVEPMSTAALRYGAWSSDADVVASWRFDEMHNHDRLNMQVRALGLTSRPVSILKRLTVLSNSRRGHLQKTMSADPGWEGSLVGEKSWMQKQWMPLFGNERQVFHGRLAGQLVQVDMPALSIYNAKGVDALSDAERHFGLLTNGTGA
eukprot:TRINITY_DN17184_c0_g1_i1.p1 TRINITY_DN17184_c0_g1~~TRINITY_DN17184_c0_g1_i1.p1  ORF type:complete len:637 (-),score=60.85 TRINITY_DN17184_c0_g1_i1:47-1957(-)